MAGGVGEDSTRVGASSWEHDVSPQLPGDDTNVVRPSEKGSSVQHPSHNSLMGTLHDQPMSHDPHGVESSAQGSGHDQLVDKLSGPGSLGQHRLDSPDSVQHAQHDSNAHDLHCMDEQLPGHLPDSADEDAPEAENEGVINQEDAVWERKQSSMTDIDFVN